jgi:hypothetical protein
MAGNIRLIWAAVFTAAFVGGFSSAVGGQESPLAHRLGPVIVKGASLPSTILGKLTRKYRLFAFRDKDLIPVPFQIDECDENGEIIPKIGPKARLDSDRGAFDKTDELVFMAWDTGVKVPGKPSIDGCEAFAEVSVPDPVSSAVGYAYLARCSKPPAPSPKKYVNWDPDNRIASTKSYRLGYEKPVYYYDHIAIYDGPDILDRLKLRTTFGLGPLRFTLNEEHFTPDVGGYTAGPVRVVYFNRCYLSFGPFGSMPLGGANYFYADYAFMDVLLDISFNPALLGLYYEVGTIADFSIDRSRGYRMCAESAPECIPVTGVTPPEIEELADDEIRWNGIAGPEGAYISWIVLHPELHTRSTGFYLDDDNARREPEYVPGSGPEIGFLIVDWKAAGTGAYYFHIYHTFMREYSMSEMKRFERAIFEPLKAEAGPFR